jgi:hypothetical protein
MQQPAEIFPSPTGPSFASLLAALTKPADSGTERRPAWRKDDIADDFADELADDVATLSYESALRANARYKPDNSGEWNLPQRIESTAALVAEESAARTKAAGAEMASASAGKIAPAMNVTPALDETRKRASVTIRMSEAECAQLQRRAAEAGLTVSAYLRSCTFEAEALRAQVKEALAELRAARPAAKAAVAARGWWRGWLTRLMTRWHFGRRVARA